MAVWFGMSRWQREVLTRSPEDDTHRTPSARSALPVLVFPVAVPEYRTPPFMLPESGFRTPSSPARDPVSRTYWRLVAVPTWVSTPPLNSSRYALWNVKSGGAAIGAGGWRKVHPRQDAAIRRPMRGCPKVTLRYVPSTERYGQGIAGSIQGVRHDQAERRDNGVEGRAVVPNHAVGAAHGSVGHRERAVARILVVLARTDGRLLSDDPVALHVLLVAVGVGDDPVAAEELGRHLALVRDADRVDENPLAAGRLLLEIAGADADSDSLS